MHFEYLSVPLVLIAVAFLIFGQRLGMTDVMTWVVAALCGLVALVAYRLGMRHR